MFRSGGDRPTSPEKTPGFVSLRRLEVSPDVLQNYGCFTRRFTGKEKMSWMDLQLFVQTFKL